MRHIQDRIEENYNALTQVIHYKDDLLTLVNVTHQEMHHNRLVINKIINATSAL